MGACGTKIEPAGANVQDGNSHQPVDVKKIKKLDKKLDEVMKLEAEQEQQEIKLLLLGKFKIKHLLSDFFSFTWTIIKCLQILL
jgi:hypothetical protein